MCIPRIGLIHLCYVVVVFQKLDIVCCSGNRNLGPQPSCPGGVCKIPQSPASPHAIAPASPLCEWNNSPNSSQHKSENSWKTNLPVFLRGGADVPSDLPVGSRIETDSFGEVMVDASKYWGALTQRSLEKFDIGGPRERMPYQVIRGLAIVKKCVAMYHLKTGRIEADKANAIVVAAEEIVSGKLQSHFPLVVFQTGSGSQSNMNVNEVISNRANEILGQPLGLKKPVHPVDDVNMGQSSNDAFPTAMHIAAVLEIHDSLLPGLTELFESLQAKEEEFQGIVKIGRTHLQDAPPLTLAQEFSGYAHQVWKAIQRVEGSLPALYELALGGTAVGTGLGTMEGYDVEIAGLIAAETGFPFVTAPNKFEALAAHDALVECSAALTVVAGSLMKIANDLRLLGSGPQSGIGELTLPANEPGSTYMPGKVNPTQCEAVSMVCAQVMGNHVATNVGGSGGHFELNTYKPLMILNLLSSARLIGDSCRSFARHCVSGILANEEKITEMLQKSQSNITIINSKIGYDNTIQAIKRSHEDGISLQQAALDLGFVCEDEDFNEWSSPNHMTSPTKCDSSI